MKMWTTLSLFFAIFSLIVNSEDDSIIFLSTPPIHHPHRSDLLDFIIDLAGAITAHGERVRIFCDNATMTEIMSRDSKLPQKVYQNFELGTIWLHDMAPVGPSRQAQFLYRPLYVPSYASANAVKRLETFLQNNMMDIRHKSNLKLEAGNLIDNENGLAITSNRVLFEQQRFASFDDIKLMITDAVGYEKLAFVTELTGDFSGQVTNMAAFVGPDTLIAANYSAIETQRFVQEVRKVASDRLEFIFVPAKKDFGRLIFDQMPKSCSAPYLGLIRTDKSIYLPYVDKPNETVKREILRTSGRTVVDIHLPKNLCELGVTPKRVSWQVKGAFAKYLF